MFKEVKLKDIGYYRQINPVTHDLELNKAVTYEKDKHKSNIHMFYPISNISKYAYQFDKVDVDLATELRFGVIETLDSGDIYLVHTDQHREDTKNSVGFMLMLYDQLTNRSRINHDFKNMLMLFFDKDKIQGLLINKDDESIWNQLKEIFPELNSNFKNKVSTIKAIG